MTHGIANQGNPRIVIIGAGMSGLLMAIRLQDAGYTDFRIYEKADDLGGTWRENTYPGIGCDVASHYYTYSFEPNPGWSSRLPGGAEIQQYLQHVASKYNLRRYIQFNTEVVEGRHDGERWTMLMSGGEQLQADIVVACCGLLHHPRYPDIEGLENFSGAQFHSARWNHDVPLEGRKVGIIGNGSTGVQIVSALAQKDLQLTVFQRTAQWIFPLPDRNYSKIERGLMRRFPVLAKFTHKFYQAAFENTFARAVIKPNWQRRLLTWLCKWHLNRVKNPELRARLTPDFVPLCKRMVMSTRFYPAMQQDNVELVTGAIERIEPQGVRTADGKLYPLDVLVLATGFDTHAYFRPLNLVNAAGVSLNDAWAQGPVAHRTVAIPGFPNFFMTLGPQSPIGNYSAISIAESQIGYIMQCIELVRRDQTGPMAPSEEATDAFNEQVRAAMDDTIWTAGCSSWYIGKSGVPSAWPFTGKRFRQELETPDVTEFER